VTGGGVNVSRHQAPDPRPREVIAFGRKVKRFAPARHDRDNYPERDAPKDKYGEIYCETCHAEHWNVLHKAGVPAGEIEAQIVDMPAIYHCTKNADYFLCENHGFPLALVAGFGPKLLTKCAVLEWEPHSEPKTP